MYLGLYPSCYCVGWRIVADARPRTRRAAPRLILRPYTRGVGLDKGFEPQFLPVGETGLLVGPLDNAPALSLAERLSERPIPGLVACVPAAASVLIRFDPLVVRRAEVYAWVRSALLRGVGATAAATAPVIIRARFGGADGPDLQDVADRLGLAAGAVITAMCEQPLRVMLIGFTPGYPYIGPLPPALHLPRRDTPRAEVPAGSVAIAAGMAGIYPARLPGGWHVIGRTDAVLFDAGRRPPSLLRAGDWVRFEPA